MRILVTGATGLIGRQVVRDMAEAGHAVIAQSRSGLLVDGAEQAIACDLLDADAMRTLVAEISASALVHLAWYADPGRMGAKENVDWAAATLRLVTTFADAGGKHVVGAGSCAEYDWHATGPFREDANLAPESLYGASKLHTGQLLTSAAAPLGLTVAWARIFFVYGPHEPRGRLMGDMIHGFKKGEQVKCSDGTQERDFLHAADVATALRLLLENQIMGAVNVGSGRAVPVRTLIDETARAFEAEHLLDIGAIPRGVGDPDRLEADMTKLRALTGFAPQYDISSGVAQVVAEETR